MNESHSRPQVPEPPRDEPVTGKLLRETRLAAKIDTAKICNDLRIAPSVLEALEKSEYHLLPGDPYIRALLGSVGRYLNLDAQALIAGYNKDIGTVQAAPAISPYKDRAHTHRTAHKQIFIAIFIVLFVVLFLIIGQLNKTETDASQIPQDLNSASVESLTVPVDTAVESHSLLPDSLAIKIPAETGSTLPLIPPTGAVIDTGKVKVVTVPNPASVTPPVNSASNPPPVLAPAAPAQPAQSLQPVQQSSAIIKPLIDSVGIKVLRKNKEDFLAVLRLGKQMQVTYQDTVLIFTSQRKSVEVILDGKSVFPEKKRFKIFGNTLKAY